jgi:hypothetical protein
MTYDSTKDTKAHIFRVQEIMDKGIANLIQRMRVHDRSKLHSPEKEMFDQATEKLRGLTYGSDEYKQSLKDLGPALHHHYEHNSHHPEHYENGIAGMSLLDLIEMLCDWKAATERHEDGDIRKSIDMNAERFGYDDQLRAIFHNTARELGWYE